MENEKIELKTKKTTVVNLFSNNNDKINKNSHLGSLKINSIRFILNYFIRFGTAGVVVYSCWIGIVNYSWFTWHVVLCTFGYIPLMAESIILFLNDEIWSTQMTRKSRYTIHGLLVLFATVIIIIGDGLVYHYIQPGYHLYTVHGITGLISMILIILTLPIGFAIKYYNEIDTNYTIPLKWYKFLHNFFGIAGYIIGMISLCYAYYTRWFIFYTTEASRLAALIVTILVLIWTLNGALVSLYQQIKSILS